MKALTPLKLKTPLHMALRTLSDVLEFAEGNDGEIPESMLPALKTAEDDIFENVGYRLQLLETVKIAQAQLADAGRTLAKRKKTLEKLNEQIRERTFREMTDAKQLKLFSAYGQFSIQENSARNIQYTVPFHEMENIIDPGDIDKVDEKYLTKLTVFVFNADAFERHLADGKIVKCFSGKDIYDVRPDAPETELDDTQPITTHIAIYQPRKSHLKVTK